MDSDGLASLSREDLVRRIQQAEQQLHQEQRKSSKLYEELKAAKEQNILVQTQAEQEEEFIVNKLMKRLDQLKREKQVLANEVEQEEEYLVNNLQRRLAKVNEEKAALESRLTSEQEYLDNQLQKKLRELNHERSKMTKEKVNLENQLEAEQEYILNKLHKQVDRLHSEKGCLQKEKAELQRTVTELGSSIDKMHRDKVALESQMEMEEEGIVNRLNRQLDAVMSNMQALESKLEARGINVKELGPLPYDYPSEWVYGRSPRGSNSGVSGSRSYRRHSRPLSASSTGSQGLSISGDLGSLSVMDSSRSGDSFTGISTTSASRPLSGLDTRKR
ncbi:hypothetical protein ABBQ38_002094 [Trebouxia sp. C0009 RCD-2024]